MHILTDQHTTTMSSTPAPTGAAAGVSQESDKGYGDQDESPPGHKSHVVDVQVLSETTRSHSHPNAMNISRRRISWWEANQSVRRQKGWYQWNRMVLRRHTSWWVANQSMKRYAEHRMAVDYREGCNHKNTDVELVKCNSTILLPTLWDTRSCPSRCQPSCWQSWQRRATWEYDFAMPSKLTAASPKRIVIGHEKGKFLSSIKAHRMRLLRDLILCHKTLFDLWKKLDNAR